MQYLLLPHSIVVATILVGPFDAVAAPYFENFDDGVANGATLTGTAVVVGGSLRLTDNLNDQRGSMNLDVLDPGVAVQGFTLSFDLATGPGSPIPADGIGVGFGSFGPNALYGENGPPNSLAVSFDTFDNPFPGDDIGIDVFVDRVLVASNFTVNPFTGGTFVPVLIHYDANGLDVLFNGTAVFTDLATGFVPRIGDRFGFGARTGAGTSVQRIDNIAITTTVPEPGSLTLFVVCAITLLLLKGTRRVQTCPLSFTTPGRT